MVRVWPDLDKVPIELCGEGLSDDASLIISKSSLVRVAFLTADRAVGAKGFEGIWTEIQDSKFRALTHSFVLLFICLPHFVFFCVWSVSYRFCKRYF